MEHKPILFDRYVRKGGKVDEFLRVTSIGVSPINPERLKSIQWDPHERGKCLYGDRCKGHLSHNLKRQLALPAWCTVLTSNFRDERGSATHAFCMGSTSAQQYSSALRSTLMTKTGLVKYDCTGFIATGSIRGVAVPVWGSDPRHVFVNKLVLSKIKVYEVMRPKEMSSKYYSMRSLVEGDHAILVRCPAMTENSLQPVILQAWDHWAIGVSPEMCEPLHLDFDGDEVHVFPLTRAASVRELSRHMRAETLNKIEAKNCSFVNAASASVPMALLMDNQGNLASMLDRREATDLGLKPKSVQSTSALIHDHREFAGQSVVKGRQALNSMISSHHRVSEGYCIARDMRYLASCVKFNAGAFVNTWYDPPSKFVVGNMSANRTLGLPGSRLAAKMAAVTTQRILDSAKRSVQAGGSYVNTFLTGYTSHNVLRRRDLPWSPRLMTVQEWLHEILEFDRRGKMFPDSLFDVGVLRQIAECYGPKRMFRVCHFVVGYVCYMDNVSFEEAELVSMAIVVNCAVNLRVGKPLAEKTGTHAWSSMKRAWYHVLLVENLKSFEEALLDEESEKAIMHSDDLISCVLTGCWPSREFRV